MKQSIRRKLRREKARIGDRLARARELEDRGWPVFSDRRVHYELADRTRATAHGGLGAVHQVALRSGLVARIDESLHLLKIHRPYHESDHVLNIAYNSVCGGQTLDDIEHRRNDEAYLSALGVEAIPDPTTAGDFCRRFEQEDIDVLMDAINETRLQVWKRSGPEFTEATARLDMDGTIVRTTGECKEGMGLSYNGIWGYHPLLVSFANTAEPLFITNRSGNRPSHEGAPCYADKAVALCRRAGFEDILLRGDTDFALTRHFDRWTDDGVRFVFSYDAFKGLKNRAESIDEEEYRRLVRRAKRVFDDKARRRPQPRVKEKIVKEKGYKNIRLRSEDVAQFEYRPGNCKRPYRFVVVRKNLTIERGEQALFDEVRFFFYVTNDWDLSVEAVVKESNQRCNQENLIEQLKNGVRALHAPTNTLKANWAYMVMASLAWTLRSRSFGAAKASGDPLWRSPDVLLGRRVGARRI